ncbi:MAG: MFS transporter [Campylobacterales bacterium]|nr:MFS transporter [Campylobacterales bacterium]
MGPMLIHLSKWRIIAAGIIGNVIEYYDFALIGFLAVIMGQLFFPSTDPFLSLLGSFGAFAAGMVMRPIGAIFFGHIGDKIGRKHALIGSLVMMALPTFLIGFLPTYAEIGIMAPIILVGLRMIQGFSVGGEYASSIVYLVEESPQGHANLYGSFVSLGAKLGMAIGAGFCGILLGYLGEDIMLEWGWRIPFWSSMALALIGVYLRRHLTDNYIAPKTKEIPILKILKHHRREFWLFLALASAIWMLYYTLFVYMPVWLEFYAGLDKATSSYINTYSIVLGVIFIPIMAIIADRVGSLRLMRISAIATAASIIPIFLLMTTQDMYAILPAISIMTLLLCAFQAPIFAATVSAISTHNYRASFTAVILGSAAGIVGGSTPALMTAVTKISGEPLSPAFLIAVFAIIGWWAADRILSLRTK